MTLLDRRLAVPRQVEKHCLTPFHSVLVQPTRTTLSLYSNTFRHAIFRLLWYTKPITCTVMLHSALKLPNTDVFAIICFVLYYDIIWTLLGVYCICTLYIPYMHT